MELHFGEGGSDSKLFVSDLLSVYQSYARIRGLSTQVLLNEDGHAILKVSGNGAWDAFKNEPGKHCVQRVPPTERSGRRQTSLISVAVLSLPPERSLVPLRDADLQITAQTGHQKAGGQNVNKVASAIRMKHLPTGLSVFINGRDQGQNKKEARRILTARVNEMRQSAQDSAYQSGRAAQMRGSGDKLGGRGDKVRTYNFMRLQIVDHQLGLSTGNVKAFMKGDFSVLYGKEA